MIESYIPSIMYQIKMFCNLIHGWWYISFDPAELNVFILVLFPLLRFLSGVILELFIASIISIFPIVFFYLRFWFSVPYTSLTHVLSRRAGECILRQHKWHLPALGCENVARKLSHWSWFQSGLSSHTIPLRYTLHVHTRRTTCIFTIRNGITPFAHRWF